MSLIRDVIHKFAETPALDSVSRAGIGFLVAKARRKLAAPPAGIENACALEMARPPPACSATAVGPNGASAITLLKPA